MQCYQFEERLNATLDARTSPARDVLLQQHAAICPACAENLRLQMEMYAMLTQTSYLIADRFKRERVAFAEEVVASHRHAANVRRFTQKRILWMISLACSTLLIFGSVLYSIKKHRQAELTHQATPASPVATKEIAVTPNTPLEPRITMPREHARLEPARLENYRAAFHSIALQLGESPELGEVGETFQPGLRPIQSSFRVALDALRRTMPHARENRAAPRNDGAFRYVTQDYFA